MLSRASRAMTAVWWRCSSPCWDHLQLTSETKFVDNVLPSGPESGCFGECSYVLFASTTPRHQFIKMTDFWDHTGSLVHIRCRLLGSVLRSIVKAEMEQQVWKLAWEGPFPPDHGTTFFFHSDPIRSQSLFWFMVPSRLTNVCEDLLFVHFQKGSTSPGEFWEFQPPH